MQARPPRLPGADSLQERLARVEVVVERLDGRSEQLAERSHDQANALTVLTGHVERISDQLDDIRETLVAGRTAAAAEHAKVREDLAPVRADFLNRMAVAADAEKRATARDRRNRIRHAVAGSILTLAGGLIAWVAQLLGGTPKP